MTRVARKFEEKAEQSTVASKDFAKRGAIVRSVASQKYADANREKAKVTRENGQYDIDAYELMSKRKKEKAYKLVAKYGDAETRKKIDDLIKANSKKPYDTIAYDETDPIISSIKKTYDSARSRSRTDD